MEVPPTVRDRSHVPSIPQLALSRPALRPPLAKPTAHSRGEDHHHEDDSQEHRDRQRSEPRKSVVHEASMRGVLWSVRWRVRRGRSGASYPHGHAG
jgi:hypothetical protein